MTEATIAQALDQFLQFYQKGHTDGTYRVSRATLRKWQRGVSAKTLEDLTAHYPNNKYLATVSPGALRTTISCIRNFMTWASYMYKVPLAIPPWKSSATRTPNGSRRFRADATKLATIRREAAEAWAQCVRPHQQAVFILGYAHGWGLNRIVRTTWQDLANLEMSATLYHILELVRPVGAHSGPAFGQWLGRSDAMAHLRWKEWVGHTIKFETVMRAGSQARVAAGILPTVGGKMAVDMWMAELVPPTAEGLERVCRGLRGEG